MSLQTFSSRTGMSSVESNFHRAFFSKLSELRIWEKYSDVTIKCGVKSFPCHRIVLAAGSEYFNAMFSSGFEETGAGGIVLHNVDARIFDQVLQLLYSGKLEIDAGSICDLIKISDYLGITALEELCFEFASENRHIVNVLELYELALILNKKVLIDMLGCCDMTEQLEEYFKSNAHLGLPFDVFAMIVKQWNTTSQDAIMRWTNSSIETRRQHFDKLVRAHAEATIPDLGASLYVHAEYDRSPDEIERIIYAINGPHSTTCSPLTDSEVRSRHVGVINQLEVVIDNSHLFILRSYDYVRTDFFMSESVDLSPTCYLKPPPITETDFMICNIPNRGIYMFDRYQEEEPIVSESNLTYEEIRRGLLFYDYGVNDYFSVPPMKRHAENACMTVLDQMLFLISGKTPGYVQAYDHRAGIWSEMPNAKFNYAVNSCCTAMDGTIYVCGVGDGKCVAQKFNIVAGKWEQIMPPPTKNCWRETNFVPYAKHLWLFDAPYHTGCFRIHVYDPIQNSWRMIGGPPTVRDVGSLRAVTASFVFKSL